MPEPEPSRWATSALLALIDASGQAVLTLTEGLTALDLARSLPLPAVAWRVGCGWGSLPVVRWRGLRCGARPRGGVAELTPLCCAKLCSNNRDAVRG
ncbi:hypothetical protein GCM10028785_14490 [Hydrogenophaga soli]